MSSPPTAVNPSTGELTYQSTSNVVRPTDLGWLAWTQDPASCSTTSAAPTAGTFYLMRVPFRYPTAVTGAAFIVSTTPGTPTTVEASVWTPDGTRRGLSANAASSFNTGGHKAVPFSSPYTPSGTSGWLWVGLLIVGASVPNLVRASSVSVNVLNPNLTVSTARFATNGTSLTATPSAITPASNSFAATGEGFWAALYT